MAELERNIGATLMRRSTRKLMLTEDGIAFLERAKRIVREVTEATAEVSERRGELVGPLRISAPVSFGILHLSAALNAFLKQNPRIELLLDLDDRFVGAADGFDAIIIRELIREDEKRKAEERLEALLLEGLKGKESKMTRDDWVAIRKEARARVAAQKGGDEPTDQSRGALRFSPYQ